MKMCASSHLEEAEHLDMLVREALHAHAIVDTSNVSRCRFLLVSPFWICRMQWHR